MLVVVVGGRAATQLLDREDRAMVAAAEELVAVPALEGTTAPALV